MTFPLHIAFRNMDASEPAEALVRERAADLEHFSDRISACRVVLDCVHRQNSMGRLYHVHIDLTLPGGSIVVTRDHGTDHAHDDLPLAIRDAFETARRKLQAVKNATTRRSRTARRPGSDQTLEENPANG